MANDIKKLKKDCLDLNFQVQSLECRERLLTRRGTNCAACWSSNFELVMQLVTLPVKLETLEHIAGTPHTLESALQLPYCWSSAR